MTLDSSPAPTRPLVLGHRGAPREARENTLEAFAAARGQGADGVELDVHRTADGALVVHHDAAVDGFGVLADHTLAEIFDALPFVPTLDAVLDLCAGMLVNVEIKNSPPDADFDPAERMAEQVVELVVDRARRDSVLVSSFHLLTIDRVHALDPTIRTGYLMVFDPSPHAALELAAARGHAAIHPFLAALGPDVVAGVVERGRELGVDVNAWTVNDEGEITRLAGAGVAAIITDIPDVALRALGRVTERQA